MPFWPVNVIRANSLEPFFWSLFWLAVSICLLCSAHAFR
jgi:hypothetical protein